MEYLQLITSPEFPEKRIGYLGLMLLLDERQEFLMLVTISLKQYPIYIYKFFKIIIIIISIDFFFFFKSKYSERVNILCRLRC
jgi:hypothetical protein